MSSNTQKEQISELERNVRRVKAEMSTIDTTAQLNRILSNENPELRSIEVLIKKVKDEIAKLDSLGQYKNLQDIYNLLQAHINQVNFFSTVQEQRLQKLSDLARYVRVNDLYNFLDKIKNISDFSTETIENKVRKDFLNLNERNQQFASRLLILSGELNVQLTQLEERLEVLEVLAESSKDQFTKKDIDKFLDNFRNLYHEMRDETQKEMIRALKKGDVLELREIVFRDPKLTHGPQREIERVNELLEKAINNPSSLLFLGKQIQDKNQVKQLEEFINTPVEKSNKKQLNNLKEKFVQSALTPKPKILQAYALSQDKEKPKSQDKKPNPPKPPPITPEQKKALRNYKPPGA